MNTSSAHIIDTHAHICDPSFDADRDVVLKKAAGVGVRGVVAVGEDLLDAERNIALSTGHSQVRAAAGLYPTILDQDQAVAMREFIWKNRSQLWAIGEVGLDFLKVKDDVDRECQRQIFSGFIELSLELDLPLNVHSRSAGRHAIEMLLSKGAQKVQLHAFDAKASTAKAAVDAGYFFSIPPSVVRSRQKQKLIKQLPLSCLMLESDSPVLGPDPQERNEPANTLLAAKAIADIKEFPLESVLAATFENTCRLYGEIY
jgi:TatD DNase family protein